MTLWVIKYTKRMRQNITLNKVTVSMKLESNIATERERDMHT